MAEFDELGLLLAVGVAKYGVLMVCSIPYGLFLSVIDKAKKPHKSSNRYGIIHGVKKKVLVALRMAGVGGQMKLAGVFRYLSERYGDDSPWDVKLLRTRNELTREQVEASVAGGTDGYILSIPDADEAIEPLSRTNAPMVISDIDASAVSSRAENIVFIHNSAKEIGRKAAAYLMGQGVARAYAFLHAERMMPWSVARFAAFRDALMENGHWCEELFEAKDALRLRNGAAIFAAQDDAAFRLVEFLKSRRRRIPGDFAVLGVDNDTLICENSRPRISSIQPDFEAEGFMAAESLDEMMREASSRPNRTLLAGVKDIVRRESTAEVSQSGRLVQRAVAFIDAHATEGVGVKDVVAHLGCSRRLADLRFRQLQGRTILDALTERRLEAVRERILTTRDTLDSIAADCGFGSSNYLKNLFKRRFSMSMSAFRRASLLKR